MDHQVVTAFCQLPELGLHLLNRRTAREVHASCCPILWFASADANLGYRFCELRVACELLLEDGLRLYMGQ